jgi:hypothetical protein
MDQYLAREKLAYDGETMEATVGSRIAPPKILSNANTLHVYNHSQTPIYWLHLEIKSVGNASCFPEGGVSIEGYNVDHSVSIFDHY